MALDWQYHDILDISPYEGVMPSPHRGTKIPNMTLEWARPIQIHSLILTEFPVKFSARLINFKVGVLRPVQQPGSYWDRSSEVPLVGLEPTEVTAYD